MRFSSIVAALNSFGAMSYAGESRSGEPLDVLLVANKRKPNFTEGESLYLISQFERNAGVLTSKLNDASTNKQKVEVWKRICGDYNSRNPIVLRTANDLKRKWKNMVRAAKKELLESTAHSESGDQSLAPRKISQVSQRIIEILRITPANCGFSAQSPGEAATGFNFDDSSADDQSEQALLEEGGAENGEREINGEQQVVHVVVKPEVKPSIVSPAVNTDQSVHDSQQNTNRESSLSALNSQTSNGADQERTQAEVPESSSSQAVRSAAPVNVVSSMPEIRQTQRVIATSAGASGVGRHRFVVPQHKRLLSSPLTHVIKKRRFSDFASDETSSSHVRAEIEKLKKEKLMLEKEKLALEKEKLVMEKEKLALEIQFLRDQMD